MANKIPEPRKPGQSGGQKSSDWQHRENLRKAGGPGRQGSKAAADSLWGTSSGGGGGTGGGGGGKKGACGLILVGLLGGLGATLGGIGYGVVQLFS